MKITCLYFEQYHSFNKKKSKKRWAHDGQAAGPALQTARSPAGLRSSFASDLPAGWKLLVSSKQALLLLSARCSFP